MRRTVCLLLILVLSACAGNSGYVTYDPNRCDRNGDEAQRRAC